MIGGLVRRGLTMLPPDLVRSLGNWQHSSPVARRIGRWGVQWIRNQDVTIKHGLGAGLKFNTAGSSAGYALGTAEPITQQVLACCLDPGAVLYDVGANVGFYAVTGARLVGAAGRVYAFEPVPESARALRENVSRNGFQNVTVIDRAVSSEPGQCEMVVSAEWAWSGLASLGPVREARRTITVEVSSIDDLVARGALAPPDVVKIDVEGAEPGVLAGMAETAQTYAPVIVCEMHGTNAVVSAFLDSVGYWQVVPEDPARTAIDAHWNAHVVAGPASKKHLADRLRDHLAHRPR